MANIDLSNLTRYDSKIKQYAENKYLSKNTANWQMTEKAGAVTCYPVPDTELEPIVDFSFKEVPPTSGEKSPSNPSTIEGVNNINLTRCNKNIFFGNPVQTEYGTLSITKRSDGSVVVNGTYPTTAFLDLTPRHVLKEGLTYTLSGCPNTNGGNSSYVLRFGDDYYSYDSGNGKTIVIGSTGNVDTTCIQLKITGDYDATNEVFYPQVELGTERTSFEKGEGNIYTYSLGNTYYGGSVNLATGLMTVTQNFVTFTGTETGWRKTGYSNNSISSFAIDLLPKSTEYPNLLVCSHFPRTAGSLIIPNTIWIWDNGICFICLPGSDITVASFKEWLNNQYLANTPVTLTYPLTNPYVVQLDPIQIKSLTALDKNTPRLNTLYTNANSIQVGYQKHPARTAYELENAILALGGGE